MAALTSQKVRASFEQLIHVDRDGGGNGTTLVSVKDGDNGTTFALQLATDHIALTDGSYMQADKIKARDGDGLALQDDGGNGLFIEDGGQVGRGTATPEAEFDIVGTASTATNLKVYSNQSTPAGNAFLVYLHTDHPDYGEDVLRLRADGINNHIGCQNETTHVFRVEDDGNVVNLNDSYGGISDARLKKDIVDATEKLSDLLKVRIRNFVITEDKDQKKQIGVIAQELEKVFPSLVYADKDGMKAVKTSVFIPIIIKAFQELHCQYSDRMSAVENENRLLRERLDKIEAQLNMG